MRLLLLPLLAACSSKPHPDTTATTVGGDFGELTVWLDTEQGLLITRDETELAWIRPDQFQAREASASYEMRFGSFLIEETAETDWISGNRLSDLKPFSDRIQFAVRDIDENVITMGEVVSHDDGHLSIELASDDNRIKIGMACAEDDHLVGLGSQARDVDHMGRDVFLFVTEPGVGKSEDNIPTGDWMITGQRSAASISIPGWVTSRGSAWRLETDHYANLDVCAADPETMTIEVWESTMELHLFNGPEPLEARAAMLDWVGRPPMPPTWAFAPWNDALFGTENVLAFAEFLRENEIPSSAIWSEDWRGGHWQSYGYRIAQDWTVNEELYPNFEEMNATLEEMGISFQAYFNPNVNSAADIFEEARDSGYLIANTDGSPMMVPGAEGALNELGILDLTNPDAWDFAKDLMHLAIEQGADGWMADYAEWTPIDGAVLFDGSDPEAAHNLMPQLWQTLNAEVAEEAALDQGMGIYYRSGHRSAPRTATIVWAGDQRTSFDDDDGLPTVVPIGLGLAAAGVPFYGHDIAGYQFIGNSPGTKELFFRWTMLGALSPIMRTHHGTKVNDNWDLDDDEESTAHWKRYAELHVQLYPYIRGLAVEAVNNGAPLWIPMGLVHPDEDHLWAVTDQYYFGRAMLVAPVVTESEADDGSTTRTIQVPPGRFVPWMSDGEAVDGPTELTVTVPIDEIPVYLSAGGIVPMTSEPALTLRETEGMRDLSSTEGNRTLYVALGADGTFTEESGASYALEGDGITALTTEVTGNGAVEGDGWTLTLSGHPEDRVTTVIAR